jgi:xanthine dehydrogenase molybdopterin-binding subunit B
VEGGTLQAVGYATIEEIKVQDGRYLNDRLATYLIPTALDAPRIETILVEAPFPLAPHGVKGVGELPMDVGAPAVIAAIHDAIGVWVTDLPATPEKLFAALASGDGVAAPQGVGAARTEAALDAPIEAGTDPAPDRRTDPQPFRAPLDPEDR